MPPSVPREFLVLFEPGTLSDLPGRSRASLREVFCFFKDRAGPKKITEGGESCTENLFYQSF